jgi:hypothetical protein
MRGKDGKAFGVTIWCRVSCKVCKLGEFLEAHVSLCDDSTTLDMHMSVEAIIKHSSVQKSRLVPKNPSQDISVTSVGQEAGLRMNCVFRLMPKWTSSPSHVGP